MHCRRVYIFLVRSNNIQEKQTYQKKESVQTDELLGASIHHPDQEPTNERDDEQSQADELAVMPKTGADVCRGGSHSHAADLVRSWCRGGTWNSPDEVESGGRQDLLGREQWG